jgi:hypothetical protein
LASRTDGAATEFGGYFFEITYNKRGVGRYKFCPLFLKALHLNTIGIQHCIPVLHIIQAHALRLWRYDRAKLPLDEICSQCIP